MKKRTFTIAGKTPIIASNTNEMTDNEIRISVTDLPKDLKEDYGDAQVKVYIKNAKGTVKDVTSINLETSTPIKIDNVLFKVKVPSASKTIATYDSYIANQETKLSKIALATVYYAVMPGFNSDGNGNHLAYFPKCVLTRAEGYDEGQVEYFFPSLGVAKDGKIPGTTLLDDQPGDYKQFNTIEEAEEYLEKYSVNSVFFVIAQLINQKFIVANLETLIIYQDSMLASLLSDSTVTTSTAYLYLPHDTASASKLWKIVAEE